MGRSYGGHMTRYQVDFSLGEAVGSFAAGGAGVGSAHSALELAARKSTSTTRRRASAAPAPPGTYTARSTSPQALRRAMGHLLVRLGRWLAPEVVRCELAEGRAGEEPAAHLRGQRTTPGEELGEVGARDAELLRALGDRHMAATEERPDTVAAEEPGEAET